MIISGVHRGHHIPSTLSKTRTSLKSMRFSNFHIKKAHENTSRQLYYKTLSEFPKQGYIPWHQDKDSNDGDDIHPVLSFTIGDTAKFLVCNNKPIIDKNHPLSHPKNLDHEIELESGDVLILGGPSRRIFHGIYHMVSNTAPDFLSFKDARLNFTFRYAPQIKGEEDNFS